MAREPVTKPKLGRPRRSALAADERVTIRLTKPERAELELAAGDVPLSDWIRDVALDRAR